MSGLDMKYFVLKPKSKTKGDPHAYAARRAMQKYAEEIHPHDALLAQELWDWTATEDCEDHLKEVRDDRRTES